ncbi:hypothetical protein KDA_26650 [Dictyobacter alpinus]|uniref:Uncharacterized protein n=1 Tax=Dictyobacter alpinus TaxID=2014873 RepID=A0A402B736_9CHLR|nr:hypothetical protein [Dictyobacter alpinus]GCE27181.1 hypothetical protein KDA_26650 [Dictyobacter alpinus]
MQITTLLILLTGFVFCALLCWLYLRSRQGDQRIITTVNSMLLPILSALVVTINLLFAYRKTTPTCTGTPAILFIAGIVLAIALILFGCLRFFFTQRRDRRTITQPLLLATMLVTITFLGMRLGNCL